jgi:hypothetical protein
MAQEKQGAQCHTCNTPTGIIFNTLGKGWESCSVLFWFFFAMCLSFQANDVILPIQERWLFWPSITRCEAKWSIKTKTKFRIEGNILKKTASFYFVGYLLELPCKMGIFL